MKRGLAKRSTDAVAVAIDKDKGSQYAIKWVVENLLTTGQALTLLHVKQRTAVSRQSGGTVSISEDNEEAAEVHKSQLDAQAAGFFLPFRWFCARKNLKSNEVMLEDTNIPSALVNYVITNSIDILVLGAPGRSGLLRFKMTDIPSTVSKEAPDYCTVYVISKGKISYVRSATRALPPKDSLCNQIQDQYNKVSESNDTQFLHKQRDIYEEKLKCMAAMEAAEAAQRIAALESQKRRDAEIKAIKEVEERKKAMEEKTDDHMYRKYTIDEIEVATNNFSHVRKIGEGGYGPVYRGEIDHTPVAIKVLRPDAAQGRSQFQQEVQVLSRMRHPYMVLLLGACPEYGCLVYEYMANGSLEDRLFRRGNTPVIPWQLRFQIAAEIGTGLLFLHQTKPEPLVHRDLKPGNILLDQNYVSKISDVGLARLVPPSVANSVTQYHMTSAVGTFCYIDPEYQQTGMLGVKSDIYSLGVMFLQLITARPPMGLTHHVQQAINKGTFAEMLDPAVRDWPVEEALNFAKIALHCAEMRRKDRPDLGKVVVPELNRLRSLADHSKSVILGGGGEFSPSKGPISTTQDVISDVNLSQSGYDSSRSRSSTSSFPGRKVFSD